mmetsp:Transcript_30383/g.41205  ORF Transcript_30383/g.41205 Transcript_30383/m.41205 type:complete len:125 (+) Transcript_30383:20-394(+)
MKFATFTAALMSIAYGTETLVIDLTDDYGMQEDWPSEETIFLQSGDNITYLLREMNQVAAWHSGVFGSEPHLEMTENFIVVVDDPSKENKMMNHKKDEEEKKDDKCKKGKGKKGKDCKDDGNDD